MRLLAVILLLLMSSSWMGALRAQPKGEAPDAERGLATAERWCQGCHLVAEGQPAASDAGPTSQDLASDPARTDATLRAFLLEPQHPMPPLKLSRQDIDDLVAYIGSLRTR